MKQIFLSRKGIELKDVPEPLIENGKVLVKNFYSCVSPGTEIASLSSQKKNTFRKIVEKPEVLKSLINVLKKKGIKNTSGIISRKLGEFYELGYSSAGIVEKVGEGVKNFSKGDLVACTGGGFASHAEKILVPENLVVRVKKKENLSFYSTVALGSIAMHAVRRSKTNIGETSLVVGMGFIGQIAMQILRAAGSEVYGIDPNENFINKSKNNGFINVYKSFEELSKEIPQDVIGLGFDSAIITASNKAEDIINKTFRLCRKKSRVILVGDVDIKINREEIYFKEIEFSVSASYGPGRYDLSYEIEGRDYPLEYVRWTLNRNMKSYVNLIDNKKINLKNLIDKVEPIELAKQAYSAFEKRNRPISTLFKYNPKNDKVIKTKFIFTKKNRGSVSTAVIGVGGFSNEIIIPNLLRLKKYNSLDYLCVKKPLSYLNTSSFYKNIKVINDYDTLLKKKLLDVVFISTRHNSHWQLTKKALLKKKHVFCEKPFCISVNELKEIKSFFTKKKSSPILVSGFNRRFSKSAQILKDFVKKSDHPIFLNYTVNADKLPPNSWIYSNEGGGRNIGEACHFYDLILFLIECDYTKIDVNSINSDVKNFHKTDNFFVTIKFNNGSIAQLNYNSVGSDNGIKEIIEIKNYNRTIIMENFQKIIETSNFQKKVIYSSKFPDKGYQNQYESFFKNIKVNKSSISIEEQIKVMKICFEVEELI
jgi:predicted dehydrogenase/threonine dehydrogenase-like Zn-dependent dehydrogenase